MNASPAASEPPPPVRRSRRPLVIALTLGVIAAVVVGVVVIAAGADRGPARYVGRDTCAQCHQHEHEQWVGSDHDLAMQLPTERSVLGDFSDAEFTHFGQTTRFFRDGEKFMVNAQGPDGHMHDYEIAYTFGHRPLQQYLVAFPGGRYQSLTIAWDAVENRWYSLYPDQLHAPDDWLHWSQRGQNWNANCAECHSTDLRKNYDIETDTYDTTFAEINVSCEACHGPGSHHVDWANASGLTKLFAGYDESTKGLVHTLKDHGRAWGLDENLKPKLMHTSGLSNDTQIDACARCHSLRSPLTPIDRVGDAFLDHWAPTLVRDSLYHADGQIDGEVYEYGSFHQSKMHQAGVTCTDCHNAHSLELIAPGNALCIRCHVPTKYDVPAHHHHLPGSTGASCVECHMPTNSYMVIDPRRDHSIRIPRPDLTPITGAPNACNQCHTDKDPAWATAAVKQWYGDAWPADARWGPALAAAWRGDRNAAAPLVTLLDDASQPAFIRASAAWAMQAYLDPATLNAAVARLADPAPLVRREAAVLLVAAPPDQRVQALAPLLNDHVRAVRYAAARSIAAGAMEQVPANVKPQLDRILAEHEAGLTAHADNRGGRAALAGFYEDLGRDTLAMAHYRKAVEFDPRDVDVTMALVRMAIRLNHDREAESHLRRLLKLTKPPEAPADNWARAIGEVHYQLGLLLASNEQRRNDGLRHLGEAATRLADVPRVHYNFALALSASNRLDLATQQLLIARQLDPTNPEYLFTLATIHRDHGQLEQALGYAQELLIANPQSPQAQNLFRELQREAQQR